MSGTWDFFGFLATVIGILVMIGLSDKFPGLVADCKKVVLRVYKMLGDSLQAIKAIGKTFAALAALLLAGLKRKMTGGRSNSARIDNQGISALVTSCLGTAGAVITPLDVVLLSRGHRRYRRSTQAPRNVDDIMHQIDLERGLPLLPLISMPKMDDNEVSMVEM